MAKIFFVLVPPFNPNAGGVERTTYKLGKYFTENGLEVVYYSLSSDGHVSAEYGRLFHAPALQGSNNPKNIADLEGVLSRERPNIVINQMPYERPLRRSLLKSKSKNSFILLGCLRNSLFSFISNVRDISERALPPWLFGLLDNALGLGLINLIHRVRHGITLREILDIHDRYILLTEPNRTELNYFVGNYKSSKVIAIPNSIPGVSKSTVEKEQVILHVGRLNVLQKRSDLLLEFWEHAHASLPGWSFVIVGDGPYMESLQETLNQKKLPRVKLEGYQKPESYYEKASIFMMPSAFEGFPNTVLETQSYGCVPLAFDSYASISWIVNNGEDAILSPPFDTRHMAKFAVELATDGARLSKMSKASLANASRFTIDRVGLLWMKLFKELGVLHDS